MNLRKKWGSYKIPSNVSLVIPIQDFTTEELKEFAEHLSFHPWHSLAEHRPLGGLNRARKVIYSEISRFRHTKNSVVRKEPVGRDKKYS